MAFSNRLTRVSSFFASETRRQSPTGRPNYFVLARSVAVPAPLSPPAYFATPL